MTTRTQIFRSSIAGNRPAVGTRAPGELYLNFADQVLGYIDPSQRPVDFSKYYVGDNRVINGDMRIERNNGATITPAVSTYSVDRWKYSTNLAKVTVTRAAASAFALNAMGNAYYLYMATSAVYAAAASDIFRVYQPVEADMISDFQWGTANAQPVTLSFWASASIGGTYSGAISDPANGRSYPFAFVLPTNTWTKCVVTIPGDQTSSWTAYMSGNGMGLQVWFDLGSGSTYRGPAGAWSSGAYSGVTGAASILGTLNANFLLTGVKLETGSVATPFNRQSLAKSMADCQRYYNTSYYGIGAPGTVSNTGMMQSYFITLPSAMHQIATNVFFPVTMRAAPTLTIYSPVTGASGKARDFQNSADITPTASTVSASSFPVIMPASAASTVYNCGFHFTASAEL